MPPLLMKLSETNECKRSALKRASLVEFRSDKGLEGFLMLSEVGDDEIEDRRLLDSSVLP